MNSQFCLVIVVTILAVTLAQDYTGRQRGGGGGGSPCEYGSSGQCDNGYCPRGSECRYITGYPYGICCNTYRPSHRPQPPSGCYGQCGGIVSGGCRPGYQCIYPSSSTVGYCCPRSGSVPY